MPLSAAKTEEVAAELEGISQRLIAVGHIIGPALGASNVDLVLKTYNLVLRLQRRVRDARPMMADQD